MTDYDPDLADRLRRYAVDYADLPFASDMRAAAAALAPPVVDLNNRNRGVRELRALYYPFPRYSHSRAAELILAKDAAYGIQFDRERHGEETSCPLSIRGTIREWLWLVRTEGGPLPGWDRLKKILGRRSL